MADQLTDAAIEAAIAAGQKRLATVPHGVNVYYVTNNDIIVVELNNGCHFGFPSQKIQGLEGASPAQLAEVTLQGAGYALDWPNLDVQADLQALMAGIFGTRSYMAKIAGTATSEKKAAAARENGAKGGRPPGSPYRNPRTAEKITKTKPNRAKIVA
jgi:hypothetical protein